MSENRKIRVFYQFNGYVQGVGFRYRMSHLAGHFGVTGWVRNEYDGSVQAELQGLPEEIDMIIQDSARTVTSKSAAWTEKNFHWMRRNGVSM